MVTVDLPRGIVFYAVLAAFALMFVRAIQVFIGDMRRGGPRLDTDDIAPTGA
jgi:TRAP-type C4-dicarboxylate transport system permease small subunit